MNTKKITVDLKIARKGISGVSGIDLWYSTDYKKDGYTKAPNPISQPAEPDSDKWTLTFEAKDEGLYGFYMVAQSGVGLSEKPPEKGTPPRLWVEVDLAKPVVQIQQVKLIHQPEGSYLDIAWRATDKNLAPRPIDIVYAENKDAEDKDWMEVARGLDNTGRYTWPVPDKKPFKFYVKVRAVDRATNTGEDVTKEQVTVDLVTPQIEIGEVKPVDPKR
jgi:hypothetical protein